MNIKQFAFQLYERVTNDFDSFLIIDSGSVKGTGKSDCSIQISKELCKIINFPYHYSATSSNPFTFDPIVFNPKSVDIIERVKVNPVGYPVHIDEATKVGYKRDYQKKAQKELIKFVKICRKYKKIIILNDPDFWDLDKDLRNLCDYRGIIVKRGVVQMKGKSTNPDVSDKWMRDLSAEIINKRLGRTVTNLEKCRHGIRESPGWLYDINVAPLPKKEYMAYFELSKVEELKGFEETKEKKEMWVWMMAQMLKENGYDATKIAKTINNMLHKSRYSGEYSKLKINRTTVNGWLRNWADDSVVDEGINNYNNINKGIK